MNTMKARGFSGLLVAFVLLATISPGVAAAYVIIGGTPPISAPAPGEKYTDLAQGIFELANTDFNIAGPIPIVMTRVYRSKDWDGQNFFVRPFGVGYNLNYNMYLYSRSEAGGIGYTDAEIVLPDGGQVVCNRTDEHKLPTTWMQFFSVPRIPTRRSSGPEITYNA